MESKTTGKPVFIQKSKGMSFEEFKKVCIEQFEKAGLLADKATTPEQTQFLGDAKKLGIPLNIQGPKALAQRCANEQSFPKSSQSKDQIKPVEAKRIKATHYTEEELKKLNHYEIGTFHRVPILSKKGNSNDEK
ncbi:MAG: hypothetical protein CVU71_06535 [Deltaproteobacteria bacterium HGW-Deltaproteobacteria-6]|jgi:hypothetical protein|nr:MAG: hypothetical protein CVU71_06535 [Deltaproteobacteria bacterium HGW-Deltaproteobacteria-6]